MIVKIQIPLISDDPNPQALVYNKGRGYQNLIEMTKEVTDLFQDGALKVYVQAQLADDGKLILGDRVKDQDW